MRNYIFHRIRIEGGKDIGENEFFTVGRTELKVFGRMKMKKIITDGVRVLEGLPVLEIKVRLIKREKRGTER